MKLAILLSLAALCLVAGTAFGSPVDPGADPAGWLQSVVGAYHARAWHLLISLVLLGVVAAIRAWGPAKWKRDRAGVIINIASAIVLVLVSSAMAGRTFSARWLLDGVALGITAAGGYVTIKKLLWPSDSDAPEGQG